MPDPVVYLTDHVHSNIIGKAFALGAGLETRKVEEFDPSRPAVVYGILRGCGRIIKSCAANRVDYFHIDHGYFNRGHYGGYYRITKNSRQYIWEGKDYPGDRFGALNVKLGEPAHNKGKYILLAPPSEAQAEFDSISVSRWTENTLWSVMDQTERPVLIRRKSENFPVHWEDVSHLVTYNSNMAIDALIRGITVRVDDISAALPCSTTTVPISPTAGFSKRLALFRALSYQQFTLQEMKNGTAWRILNGS